MRRSHLERALSDVHARLVKSREELTVLDEQLGLVTDAADEARIRALVSETPLAAHESRDTQRHADAFAKARTALAATIAELEKKQDELLGQLGGP
jgi:hypothetical protein